MDVFFQNPDNPDIKQNIEVKMKFENFIVEHSSDVVIAVTRLVPDYGCMLRYKDLFHNPFSGGKKSNTSLHRKIKLMTPLYYVKQKLLKKSLVNSHK